MKKRFAAILILLLTISVKFCFPQAVKPTLAFEDATLNHNFHLASDGKFYYTINGGNAPKGQIKKYDLTGKLVAAYPLNLDMRSLMYNPADKNFYVSSRDLNIYLITNMEKGSFKLVFSRLDTNREAVPALSPDGKLLYYLSDGMLKIYKFSNGKLLNMIPGIKSGTSYIEGSRTVAVDENHIYSWNSADQIIFVHDLNGKMLREVKITNGSFGASLSCANGFVFVSVDGNYDTGVWFGYDLREPKN